MKKDHLFTTELKKDHHAVTMAWYLSIQFVSKIKIRVKLLGDNFEPAQLRKFFECLDCLRITTDQVNLEFEENNTKSSVKS